QDSRDAAGSTGRRPAVHTSAPAIAATLHRQTSERRIRRGVAHRPPPDLRSRVLLRSILVMTVALTACARRDPNPCPPTDCTRVLFIGNSYTFANDLPGMFATLARATGHHVVTYTLAEGGSTLDQHAKAAATKHLLDSLPWTFVVIQE